MQDAARSGRQDELGRLFTEAAQLFGDDASAEWARTLSALDSSAGGRINAAYMTIVFVFGASGSLIGSASFAAGGWSFSSLIGAAIGGVALLLYLLFDRRSARSAEPRPAD